MDHALQVFEACAKSTMAMLSTQHDWPQDNSRDAKKYFYTLKTSINIYACVQTFHITVAISSGQDNDLDCYMFSFESVIPKVCNKKL